jgi:pyrimidine operon attenuation protein/uracil phosphoribosyltransferase
MDIEQNLILKEKQVSQMIKRIAYEIFERNFQEEEMVIAGIEEKGYVFARLLSSELEKISPFKLTLVKVILDKYLHSQSEINLDIDAESLKNKCIVLTDDVLNTGRTLAYSLKPFLNIDIKKLEIAILVNRGHKLFPVSADYYGYELSTTLKEHIEVILQGEKAGVYLH